MSQAIVDPLELRRFAQNLKKFNSELEERLTSLRAQLHGLGATWRDQEHKKFFEDFEEHMKVIGRYVEVTNEHAPFYCARRTGSRSICSRGDSISDFGLNSASPQSGIRNAQSYEHSGQSTFERSDRSGAHGPHVVCRAGR